MLPSLTADVLRQRPPRRAVLGAAGALLLALALVVGTRGPAQSASAGPATLASTLAPGTWALAIPTSWFVAPIVGLRPGDRLDVLALRPGERATATVVAFDLLVVSADERAVVVGSGADDATALGVARASGLLLLPLLRSTR
jgi:Flp pilus assembly protein CpaB